MVKGIFTAFLLFNVFHITPQIQRERYVSRLTWSSALSQLSPAQAGEAGSEAA